MTSMISIKCGAAHTSHSSSRASSRTVNLSVGKIYSGFPRINELKLGGSSMASKAPIGSWGKSLVIRNNSTVKHIPSLTKIRPSAVNTRSLTRSCAYCHDETFIHHIKNCPVLQEKNKTQVRNNYKGKQQQFDEQLLNDQRLKEQQYFAKEALIAEKHLLKQLEEPVKYTGYSFLDAVKSSEKPIQRKVSFKDDSENLMKPPCEIKVFNEDDTPTQISSDEEEPIIESSVTAWKPKRLRKEPSVNDAINAKITVLEEELKVYDTGCWADACEIEDLQEEINKLRYTLQ